MALTEFIARHFDDVTDRLLFQKDKWPEVDVAAAVTAILAHRKIRTKVPSWYRNPALVFPSSLSVEQCSSEATATHKALTIKEMAGEGAKIADLTGGIGVDSYVFSKHFPQVLYNEMVTATAEAAGNNFKVLGCGNITVRNCLLVPGGEEDGGAGLDGGSSGQRNGGAGLDGGTGGFFGLQKPGGLDGGTVELREPGGPQPSTVRELTAGFAPDVIYLDPARRSSQGRKVFRLEDCNPDVTALKADLAAAARFTVIKLSPMADIDLLAQELGGTLRLVEVISAEGECKEIVAYLDREHDGGYSIRVVNSRATFTFTREEERLAPTVLLHSSSHLSLTTGKFLLEPDKALVKAGAYKLPCSLFGLIKPDTSTHLYLDLSEQDSRDCPDDADGTRDYPAATSPDGTVPTGGQAPLKESLFRRHRIIKTVPLDKRSLKAVAKEFPCAEVTAKNVPIDSATLAGRLGVRPSGKYRIFALKVSFSSPEPPSNHLFITEKP